MIITLRTFDNYIIIITLRTFDNHEKKNYHLLTSYITVITIIKRIKNYHYLSLL